MISVQYTKPAVAKAHYTLANRQPVPIDSQEIVMI